MAESAVQDELFDHPGQKAKSVAWKFFKFKKDADGKLDLSQAICGVCRKTYANKGNTTNLVFHVKNEHQDLIKNDKKQIQPKIDTILVQGSVSGKLLSRENQEDLNDNLCKLLVNKALPVSLVSNSFMKNFLSKLDPRYKIPSKQKIKKLLDEKYYEMKERLKQDVLSSQSLALTHDGWTSLNTQSYDTITCHMITDKWELRHAVLGTVKIEGQHTGDNIAKSIKSTIDEWGICNPSAVTTDNAANELKGIRLLGLQRFGCYGHRLNLIVKKAIETPELKNLLHKGRTLVTFFHKSSSATDILVEKQKLLHPDKSIQLKLVMDCVTRWNSTLKMVERLLELMPCIINMANDQSLTKTAVQVLKTNSYTFEEESILKSVIKVLKPFETATTVLCSEKSPSMQHVLPIVKKLLLCVEKTDEDHELICLIKTTMQREIVSRAPVEELPLLATLLNPDTKCPSFLSEEELNFGKNLMLEKAEHVSGDDFDQETPSISNDVIIEENIEPKCKRTRIQCADSVSWLDDIVTSGKSIEATEMSVQYEINRYFELERKPSDSSLSLLQWWRENEKLFPRLSRLACTVLVVPASSVPAERVFSLAGNIVNKKRNRLSPALLDKFIFMKINMSNYW